ncbi:D-alanyl-D-alanine carboxypeptidase, partial [Candidatus Collierbacteria bacterium]|nr:D-alanyl-D-alanine carboxypeptidase [Candidatus Collierbacteria bacterium]
KIPTVLGLKIGEQFKLSELLRATIATSANDAAATIAEGIASQNGLNQTDFIALMNQKAALLKMENSHFANPDGLDDDAQFSTLIDIAKLVQNTIKNYPEILSAAASDREDIKESKTHGFYYLSNWNGLLGVYPGVFGLKIAFTENAGNSIIVLSERSKVRLAVIVTGAKSLYDRDASAASLLDQAFAIEKIPPANVSQWQLKQHYKVWNDLIIKTRAELHVN